MAQIEIEINRDEGAADARFEPKNQPATTRDNAFWINNDTQPHKPTPLDKNGNPLEGIWLNDEIPAGSPSSGIVFFNPDKTILGSPSNPVNVPYTITYACAVEGHENERGTIKVTA